LDVGCGIGGSSRYLSRKLNAEVIGVTLSPVQVERAREITQQNHITQPLLFMVEDALSPSFPPESFDLIWALESAEHIPRKSKLLWNWHQLLKPGGKVLFATWCHRPVPPELNTREQQQLHQLYEVFSLSPLISMDMYGALMEDVGFRNIELADWSAAVAPFWNAVIRKTRNPLNWIKILRSGKLVRNSVKGVKLMRELYKTGLIRFVVARGVK
ncbi:MAG: methyltransferase domain-containing protein, partial [Methanobacteriota archaeon]